MANNFVYIFKNKELSNFLWEAEIRSLQDGSNRPASKFSIKISKIKNTGYNLETNEEGGLSQTIRCEIRYVNRLIPVLILLKALGLKNDKQILDCITDVHQNEIRDILQGSFREAMFIKNQD